MMRRGICLLIAGLAMLATPLVAVQAQEAYPNRTVRWVVPFPAGGPTDTLSRILVARLGEIWGQSVVVENKGGASGAIGTDFVAKSPPDGYTLMLGTQSTNALQHDLLSQPALRSDQGLPAADADRHGLHGAGDGPQHPGQHAQGTGRVGQEAGWRRLLCLGRTRQLASTSPPS